MLWPCHASEFFQNGWTDRLGFGFTGSPRLIRHFVEGNSGISKIRILSCATLSETRMNLADFLLTVVDWPISDVIGWLPVTQLQEYISACLSRNAQTDLRMGVILKLYKTTASSHAASFQPSSKYSKAQSTPATMSKQHCRMLQV